jgi:3-hydroxy-9,10-secoandrosta-1,3,5(10)-triene-9,17-dione monooxygenase reductase component
VSDGPEDPLGPEAEELASFDQAHYRAVLGRFATGVTVVAAMHDGKPAGLSVNSFTSVSLDPPLVAFCVAKQSSTWPHIRHAGGFTVSILAEDQEDLSRVFAAKSPDKFRHVAWWPGPSGGPVLAGAVAWIDCTVDAEHDAGDHVIVVGRVRELDVADDGKPLIFYRGGYGRFEP